MDCIAFYFVDECDLCCLVFEPGLLKLFIGFGLVFPHILYKKAGAMQPNGYKLNCQEDYYTNFRIFKNFGCK
jgi:hypothetical protein